MNGFGRHIIGALLALAVSGAVALGQSKEIQRLEQRAVEAFEREDYRGALEILDRLLDEDGQRYQTHYNIACALAMMGEDDAAIQALLDAMKFGFVDYRQMQRDEHLASIRDHPTYKTIIDRWATLLDARADAEAEAMGEWLGSGYTILEDDERRLLYVSSFPEPEFEDARRQIELVERWAFDNVLPELGATEQRPHPWVTVILPEPEDFFRLVQLTGVGGIYDKDAKRLVTQDIGPSLRHEFFHVLHWRHMAELGQHHPFWIMEGLASVLEDVEVRGGTLIPQPSWRTNIARHLEKAGALTPWHHLFTMERREFVGRRPKANYAQARAVFLFLHERDRLRDWYARYVSTFDEDPSGRAAMEHVFDRPLEAIEGDFANWLEQLPEVAEQRDPGAASLGVELGAGTGDGPVVDGIVTGSPGWRANKEEPLRNRDVIQAIDGTTIRTLDDLHRVLGEHDPGDVVTLTVRRGTKRFQAAYELVPREDSRLPR